MLACQGTEAVPLEAVLEADAVATAVANWVWISCALAAEVAAPLSATTTVLVVHLKSRLLYTRLAENQGLLASDDATRQEAL